MITQAQAAAAKEQAAAAVAQARMALACAELQYVAARKAMADLATLERRASALRLLFTPEMRAQAATVRTRFSELKKMRTELIAALSKAEEIEAWADRMVLGAWVRRG